MSIFNRKQENDSFIKTHSGSWSLSSKKDSRWNTGGTVEVMVVTAGMVEEATNFIASKKKKLKCDPPDDLTYSCMKD